MATRTAAHCVCAYDPGVYASVANAASEYLGELPGCPAANDVRFRALALSLPILVVVSRRIAAGSGVCGRATQVFYGAHETRMLNGFRQIGLESRAERTRSVFRARMSGYGDGRQITTEFW
jgi:hypothetical protein